MCVQRTSRLAVLLVITMISVIQNVRCQDLKSSAGQVLFLNHCSRCHGVKGGGGEGPALNRTDLPRAPDDDTFSDLISSGIAGTGMPGTWHLDKNQKTQIIKFVRSLSQIEKENVNGDVNSGLMIVEKSQCLSCHVIKGRGVSLGPELTNIGLRRGSAYLNDALVHPGKQKSVDEEGFLLYLVMDVTLSDGKTVRGIRTNEDTFTLQVKDSDNRFYSFRKSQLKSINRIKGGSLMPSYSNMTKEERDNVVAFLMNQK